jgi:glutamine cyclotransferase
MAASSMRHSRVFGFRHRRIDEIRPMIGFFRFILLPALIAVLLLPAWGSYPDTALAAEPSPAGSASQGVASRPAPGTARSSTPIYTCKVVQTYPHDPQAFTQGLVFDNGILYESTGLLGRSSVRKVELKTGSVLKMQRLPAQLFGEGITVFGRRLIQLTWQSRVGFVYDKQNFRLLKEFTYSTEGWGLTHDGKRLIMSDGTATLRFLDPKTYEEIGEIAVFDGNSPIGGLNELEYVRGEVYANVWLTSRIARIDPASGRVLAWVDLEALARQNATLNPDAVLNGIAYDPQSKRLFVTGKLWPNLYEIKQVLLKK